MEPIKKEDRRKNNKGVKGKAGRKQVPGLDKKKPFHVSLTDKEREYCNRHFGSVNKMMQWAIWQHKTYTQIP